MYQKSLSIKTRLRHLHQYISPGVEEQPEEVVDSTTRDLDSQEELQVHPITHVPPESGETHVSSQIIDEAHSSTEIAPAATPPAATPPAATPPAATPPAATPPAVTPPAGSREIAGNIFYTHKF